MVECTAIVNPWSSIKAICTLHVCNPRTPTRQKQENHQRFSGLGNRRGMGSGERRERKGEGKNAIEILSQTIWNEKKTIPEATF